MDSIEASRGLSDFDRFAPRLEADSPITSEGREAGPLSPLGPELLVRAREAGFDLVGIGPAGPGADGERFADWIAAGRHASMAWLERDLPRIQDPGKVLAGARSALCLGLDYARPEVGLEGGGRVARYAAGRDYHRAIGARLGRLGKALADLGLQAEELRPGVDAVPILERALALRAGIGFLAKSSGIIHPKRGPWLLLAEVLTTVELEATPASTGSCGSCTACLEACPTGAIVAPFELDARRCLSWSTIENRGPTPRALRAAQGDWLFGCDLCIECCPFASRGGRAAREPSEPDLRRHAVLERFDLVGFLELGEAEYDEHFRGTALRRARRDGLRRNAAIALGNLGREDAVPALLRALREADAGLRAAAGWALAELGRERDALVTALDGEEDPATRADLAESLEAMH